MSCHFIDHRFLLHFYYFIILHYAASLCKTNRPLPFTFWTELGFRHIIYDEFVIMKAVLYGCFCYNCTSARNVMPTRLYN